MAIQVAMEGVFRHICRTEARRLYDLLGDSELLARFLAERDEAAFEHIVLRHGPMVRAVCRRTLGATADADDAFQAAFLVLVRKARSIRRADLLANWLCAVAYRTARQALRRRWRIGRREQNVERLPERAHHDDAPRDWLPLFDAALQKVPGRYRDAVVLCDLDGLSRPDAARKLGLNEGTLSSRLGRGRDLLRKKLVRHGFPLAVGSAIAPAVVPESLTASTVAAAIHVGSASVSAVNLMEGVLAAMFATKFKAGLTGTAIVALGLVAGLQFTGPATHAGGPPPKEGPAPKTATKQEATSNAPKPSSLAPEYELLQGEWVVTAAEMNGKEVGPASAGVDELWRFRNCLLTTGGDVKDDAGEKITIDDSDHPAKIDFTLSQFMSDGSGRLVRTAYQGIYKVKPDGLLICYRQKVDSYLRPTRFATAANSGATLLTLRRPGEASSQASNFFSTRYVPVTSYRAVTEPMMPPAMDPSALVPPLSDPLMPPPVAPTVYPNPIGSAEPYVVETDARALQGVWRMDLGRSKPGGNSREESIEFLKDRVLVSDGTHGRFKLDLSKSPKQITITMVGKDRDDIQTGIYKIEGDLLTIAIYNGPGKLVPTVFEPDNESHVQVVIYQRMKPTPPPAPSAPILDLPKRAPSMPAESHAIPSQPAERDLVKEIDQLKEQIRRLEKALKDRK
jgi:RNA polymerase sigma factor (sigma-70 family)